MKYLLILFIFVFSAFANNENNNQSKMQYATKNLNLSVKEKEYLKNNPIIKVGFTDVFEPFFIQTPSGNNQGLIPAMYKLISEKFPISFEYHISDWKKTIKNLEEGKVDLIPAMSSELAKRKGFLLANPLYRNGFQLYTKDKNNLNIKSLKDLKNKKIGFNANIIVLNEHIKKYQNIIDFIPLKNSLESFYKLDNGSLDAVISFNSERYVILKYGLIDIKATYNVSEFKPSATTAIKSDNYILQSIMDKAISYLSADEKRKIIEKYLGEDFNQSSFNLNKEEKEYLESKAFLTTQLEKEYYPYFFTEDGKNKGFLVDLIDIVSSKIGKTVEYITIENKKEAKQMLLENKIDFISHYLKTPNREKEFLFNNESILNANVGLLSKKENNYTLENIDNKTVAVVKGYTLIKIINKHYPKLKINLFNNNFELIESVLNGSSDVGISNYTVMNYLMRKNQVNSELTNTVLNNEHFYTRPTHIAFNKENRILKDIFDKAIESSSVLEMNELYNKWFLNTKKDSFLLKEEQTWLKKNKIIKICANPIWAPISFNNEKTKKPEGIAIDTMKLIEQKLDNKLVFDYVYTSSWKEAQEFLKQKKCDVLPILGENKKRAKYAIFTKTYLHYKYAIITQVNKPFAKGLEDVVEKSLARKQGSGSITRIKEKYPNAKIIETKNFLDSIQRVSRGEAYSALATLPVLSYHANRFGIQNIQIAGYANMQTHLAIGVNKDKVILRDILDKALDQISSVEHKAIEDKWMGVEIKEIKSNNLFYISISIILLFLAFYYFYRDFKSKKELKKINIKLQKFNETLEQKVSEQTKELKKINLELSISNEQLTTTNQELHNSNEELLITEEDLRIRQMELISQHEKILELSKIKGQFLANMSHEIRTPLNGIVGITRLMLEDSKDMKQKHKEQLNIIKKSSEILTNVVNDILDYSALSTGNITLFEEEFSLVSMLEHIQSITEINIKEKGIKYIVDIDKQLQGNVIGDEFRISQILMNIINNATKFTKKGYIKLKVRKRISQSEVCALRFTIVDTGIGMNDNVQNSLFNSFIQSDQSNTREHKGTGLGLSIVQQLVHLMKGKVTTQSTEGQGSTFFVDITLKCASTTSNKKEIPNSTYYHLTKSKKALFVEDDEINQLVISETLKKIGFETDYANNGKEAVEKTKINEYDIIFMDIQMPIMDGYEATKLIRQDNKEIPIIALSAGVMAKDIDKSLEAGMNMHIAKPIVYNEINEVLDRYFEVVIKE